MRTWYILLYFLIRFMVCDYNGFREKFMLYFEMGAKIEIENDLWF